MGTSKPLDERIRALLNEYLSLSDEIVHLLDGDDLRDVERLFSEREGILDELRKIEQANPGKGKDLIVHFPDIKEIYDQVVSKDCEIRSRIESLSRNLQSEMRDLKRNRLAIKNYLSRGNRAPFFFDRSV